MLRVLSLSIRSGGTEHFIMGEVEKPELFVEECMFEKKHNIFHQLENVRIGKQSHRQLIIVLKECMGGGRHIL
jgi:hypothetical protein